MWLCGLDMYGSYESRCVGMIHTYPYLDMYGSYESRCVGMIHTVAFPHLCTRCAAITASRYVCGLY